MSTEDSTLPAYELRFRPEAIAAALWIAPDQAIREFRDGRVVSRFSEYWAALLYQFERNENSNEAGHDGTVSHPLLGRLHVCVRCLGQGRILFQQSKFIGSGRACTRENLLASLAQSEFVIVVDIADFPAIRMIPVATARLRALVEEGLLTPSGLTRTLFYERAVGRPLDRVSWQIREIAGGVGPDPA